MMINAGTSLELESEVLIGNKYQDWQEIDPKSALFFSSTSYYFGVHLQESRNVPIGLIQRCLLFRVLFGLKVCVPPKVFILAQVKGKTNLPYSLNQKIFQPVCATTPSKTAVPNKELPLAFSPGDQTVITPTSGMMATTPPPTPLFPGKPTRKAKSPEAS